MGITSIEEELSKLSQWLKHQPPNCTETIKLKAQEFQQLHDLFFTHIEAMQSRQCNQLLFEIAARFKEIGEKIDDSKIQRWQQLVTDCYINIKIDKTETTIPLCSIEENSFLYCQLQWELRKPQGDLVCTGADQEDIGWLIKIIDEINGKETIHLDTNNCWQVYEVAAQYGFRGIAERALHFIKNHCIEQEQLLETIHRSYHLNLEGVHKKCLHYLETNKENIDPAFLEQLLEDAQNHYQQDDKVVDFVLYHTKNHPELSDVFQKAVAQLSRVTVEHLNYWQEEELANLQLPQVKTIYLARNMRQAPISDHTLHLLLKACPNVVKIDTFHATITGSAFQVPLLQLKEVRLYGCRTLTEEGLRLLLQHAPALEVIDLSGTPITGAAFLHTQLDHLKQLTLQSCRQLNSTYLSSILSKYPDLKL